MQRIENEMQETIGAMSLANQYFRSLVMNANRSGKVDSSKPVSLRAWESRNKSSV